jgi:hypothetical protein
MLRLPLRFLGFVLLAFGFALVIVDSSRSIAASELVLTPLTALLGPLGEKLASLEPAARAIHPLLWDPVLKQSLAAAPASAWACAIGLLLMILTRKAPPKIGFSSR